MLPSISRNRRHCCSTLHFADRSVSSGPGKPSRRQLRDVHLLYGFPAFHLHRHELASDLRVPGRCRHRPGGQSHHLARRPTIPREPQETPFRHGPRWSRCIVRPEILVLNKYLGRLCSWMPMGTTFSKLAVYLPWEDNLMHNELPDGAFRSPAALYYWEMRHDRVPRDRGLQSLVDLGCTSQRSPVERYPVACRGATESPSTSIVDGLILKDWKSCFALPGLGYR